MMALGKKESRLKIHSLREYIALQTMLQFTFTSDCIPWYVKGPLSSQSQPIRALNYLWLLKQEHCTLATCFVIPKIVLRFCDMLKCL